MNELINSLLPAVIRFSARPGLWLLRLAAVADAFFLLVAFLAVRNAGGPLAWLLLLVALAFSLATAAFAWRRQRLSRHVAAMEEALTQQRLGGAEVGSTVANPAAARVQEDFLLWEEVRLENSIRSARYLPRVEAAQRAMVRAAGGVVAAPYLKDDLRITLVTFLGTIAAIPAAMAGSFLALLVLALN